jgi:beta-phosphoglucomutase family hydrolase
MAKRGSAPRCAERPILSPHRFEAAIFDLDGVVTDTAGAHAKAWETAFNSFLGEYAKRGRRRFEPFTPEDYRAYVDGRPRREAIRTFLESRGVALAEGETSDPPGAATVRGLAAQKNQLFLEHVRTKGVEIYASTVALVRRLRSLGLKTAVVSASRNCREILRTAHLESLFDISVTGSDLETLSLKGKPAPDSFLEAARQLEVSPLECIVVEDAISGVTAARAGDFGFVIGVDRGGNADALRSAGADIVVRDLSEIELHVKDELTGRAPWGRPKPDVHRLDPFAARAEVQTRRPASITIDPWVFAHDGFDPRVQGRWETLFALGNGYFVTRGAAAEAQADDVHYPGTYLAGGYNRLATVLNGRSIEHEDLVNLPNWLPLTFRIDDGQWFDLRNSEILAYRQELDLRNGIYVRTLRVEDGEGRQTRLTERRFVHMRDRYLAGQHVRMIAENWSGRLTLRAMLDGKIANAGVPRYSQFASQHFQVNRTDRFGPETFVLEGETVQSQLRLAQAARLRARLDGQRVNTRQAVAEPGRIGQDIEVEVSSGATLEVEKIVALHTSRDRAIADSGSAARETISRAASFDELLPSHALAWEQLWRRCDIDLLEVAADFGHETHLAVRLHIFHLLQTVSGHTIDLDAGVPARGWHGEAYRGHIFWDELFIFPFLNLRLPTLTRALLLYRHRRLPEARWAAREAGHRGAMFPWQSGSSGREETDVTYFNPLSGRWIEDNTHLQRHVGAAVAYNVWQYYQATGDNEFLYIYGAELMLEIARFWSSIAEWNTARSRYDIRGVMGPDEFHDRYPDREAPGLNNNAYTNVMASWCIARALELFELLPDERCQELCESLDIKQDELAHWEDVSRKLYIPFHDGMLSQFEGYETLEEFDWEAYRRKYRNLGRLDLILEAEGVSPSRFKLSKQADVLMLFYLFSAEELSEIFARLRYPFDPETIPETINYYLRRTSHGSTLSGMINAWVLARSCRRRSWSLFTEALESDIGDIQGGTTREGIHLGAMAGTLDILQRCFTGLELRKGELRFHPVLPDELKRQSFKLRYRGQSLKIQITQSRLQAWSEPSSAESVSIIVDGQRALLEPGGHAVFTLQASSAAGSDGANEAGGGPA